MRIADPGAPVEVRVRRFEIVGLALDRRLRRIMCR